MVPSGGPVFMFGYGYNAANLRTHVALAAGSRWACKCDVLGQLTNGCKFWNDDAAVAGQQFEYAFDSIGNRTATKVGNSSAMRMTTYTNNLLNQINTDNPFGDAQSSDVPIHFSNENQDQLYRSPE